MGFKYNGYQYWYSVIDSVYYRQKIGEFEKEEISEDDYFRDEEEHWWSLVV